MNSIDNISARDTYARAKEVFFRAFLPSFKLANGMFDENAARGYVNSLKLSQSEIRLEVELNTTTNNFVFGVTTNQNNSNNLIFGTENRLNQTDSIVVSEYGIFVANTAGQNDTAFQLRNYGNTIDFPLGSAALNTTFFSNGSFGMLCNNDVIIPYRGLNNHWVKPQTQQTAALGAGSPDDEIIGATYGFVTMEPNAIVIGTKNNVPQINLRSNLAALDANTRAILIMRGIVAQNSTINA